MPGKSSSISPAIPCLGFHLRDNFRFPYAAVGFSDFWRRWHISLSTFLRDYLYIPPGGNRSGAARAMVNLIIVMFIGGLWHGAAWTFVVWGLLHGSYLAMRLIRGTIKDAPWTEHPGVKLLLSVITYLAVLIAWVYFRASDFETASRMIRGMFDRHAHPDAILSTREILQVGIVTFFLLLAHLGASRHLTRNRRRAPPSLDRHDRVVPHGLRHHPHPGQQQCLHLLPVLISNA